jgi:ABC-type multidrug transport system fused ATPase/permease subunit
MTRRSDGGLGTGQTEDGHKPRNLFGIVASIKVLGLESLYRRLLWLATCALISGLSQAAILVILSELAVGSVQGKNHLKFHGLALSNTESVLLCVALLAAFGAGSVAAAFASSSMTTAAVEAVRRNLIDSFFTADWATQSSERLGGIQQLLTVNSESVGAITTATAVGLQSLLTVLAMLGAAFLVNSVVAIVVLVAGVILSAAMRPFLKWSKKASATLSRDIRRMATLVTEFTRLTRDFRLLGVEDRAIARMQEENHEAALSANRTRRLMAMNPVVYQTCALGFIVIGLAILVGHHNTTLGATGAVILLTLRSLTYGANIQSNSQQLRGYEAFLEGIESDIARYAAHPSERVAGEVPKKFDVTFDHAWFSYDGISHALQDVSFEVPSGSMLGVVGRSGSGKTTLSQLVLGLRRPTEGSVLVGDVPADALRKGGGMSPVALVPQEPVLMQGSIGTNIAFFRDISPEAIEEASRASHLHEDVTGMSDSYDTPVGEGGGSISGGQRQRLAIARALAGAPRLLVLDEPTSALDGRSESLIRQTLSELRGRVTIAVISHRMSTIEDCDFLLVLEQGRVADFGVRHEVMRRPAFHYAAEAELLERLPDPTP